MVLKTDFLDGDFLTAGLTTSTSSVNGITATINSIFAVPVGSIVAWAKTLTSVPALPDGWLECDGQTISDADSPMDGEDVPNLNNAETAANSNRFLRGSPTSGGTSGTETHTHTHSPTGNFQSGAGSTSVVNHLPPYYNVVWIMRIK